MQFFECPLIHDSPRQFLFSHISLTCFLNSHSYFYKNICSQRHVHFQRSPLPFFPDFFWKYHYFYLERQCWSFLNHSRDKWQEGNHLHFIAMKLLFPDRPSGLLTTINFSKNCIGPDSNWICSTISERAWCWIAVSVRDWNCISTSTKDGYFLMLPQQDNDTVFLTQQETDSVFLPQQEIDTVLLLQRETDSVFLYS